MLLGRAAGLTEDKLAHLGDDPLPEGVYEPDEAAIVRYAQRSTRMDVIDDRTYRWDATYNKKQRADVRAGGPMLIHDYGYDAAYRLT